MCVLYIQLLRALWPRIYGNVNNQDSGMGVGIGEPPDMGEDGGQSFPKKRWCGPRARERSSES